MSNALESLIGKLIKIVYSDSGETKIRKGKLAAADDQLLTLQTLEHTYCIGRNCVIEIKLLEEEGGR